MTKVFVLLFFAITLVIGIYLRLPQEKQSTVTPVVQKSQSLISSPLPSPTLPPIPAQKTLENSYHIFQSFNNCGPAALSMTLSYYGINESQEKLGKELRPYQIPGGDNDDKSVTLEELAEKSKEYNLLPYHRPSGNIEIVKRFIANDIPVITRTWLKENDDIGHYRVIKGYDGDTIIQDDSLQGKNLRYSQSEFNSIWKKFNYEYLVLVPVEKKEIAEIILGENTDPKVAWQRAAALSEKELEKNPSDTTARFNLSVAYTNLGEHKKAVEEFEKVENQLSFRTLWYQIEPIQSYYELGKFDRVFEITDKILNNHNRAYSEAYIIRGKIFQKQNNPTAARAEFDKAVFYNQNLKAAKDALSSLN